MPCIKMQEAKIKNQHIITVMHLMNWSCNENNNRRRSALNHILSKSQHTMEIALLVESKYAMEKKFVRGQIHSMTLILYLHTSFKVTAHPLTKGTLWLKYESNWTKWRGVFKELSIITSISGFQFWLWDFKLSFFPK